MVYYGTEMRARYLPISIDRSKASQEVIIRWCLTKSIPSSSSPELTEQQWVSYQCRPSQFPMMMKLEHDGGYLLIDNGTNMRDNAGTSSLLWCQHHIVDRIGSTMETASQMQDVPRLLQCDDGTRVTLGASPPNLTLFNPPFRPYAHLHPDHPHLWFPANPSLMITKGENDSPLHWHVPVWFGHSLTLLNHQLLINSSSSHTILLSPAPHHYPHQVQYQYQQQDVYNPHIHAMTTVLSHIGVEPLINVIADYLFNDMTRDRLIQSEQSISLNRLWNGVRLLDPLMFTPSSSSSISDNKIDMPTTPIIPWLQSTGISGIVASLNILHDNHQQKCPGVVFPSGQYDMNRCKDTALAHLQTVMSRDMADHTIDHIYAQLRGSDWLQIVINRHIYHIRVPYPPSSTNVAPSPFAKIEPAEGSHELPHWIQLTTGGSSTNGVPLWLRFVWIDPKQLMGQFQLIRCVSPSSP
jgi:hypothetical protein